MSNNTDTITAEQVTSAIRAANQIMFGDSSFVEYGVPTFTDQAEVDRFVALTVEMIDEIMLTNGVAWTAKITDGDWSFDVENRGNGGCNHYLGDYGSTERFADELYPDGIESLDTLIAAVESYGIGAKATGLVPV